MSGNAHAAAHLCGGVFDRRRLSDFFLSDVAAALDCWPRM